MSKLLKMTKKIKEYEVEGITYKCDVLWELEYFLKLTDNSN